MPSSAPRVSSGFEDRVFLGLVAAVSVAFAWIVWPLAAAILWGTIIAILFAPLQRRLTRALGGRHTLAALLTLTIVVVIVILPLTFVAVLLAEEASDLYTRVRSGEMSVGMYFRQIIDALPPWAVSQLDRFGLTDFSTIQQRVTRALLQGSQAIAASALSIGQSTFDFIVSLFVMLYLLFFFLRDGDLLSDRIAGAVPLRAEQRQALAEKFTVVIRATVKGSIVVAVVQGILGGFIFWALGIHAPLLWGVVMTVLSLLPAVGAALVWLPVAIYFLATGRIGSALLLIAFGIFVIGLVDNVLRPVLVGKDTRMPDYLVLVATLGGIAVLGVNGFVLGPVIAALFIAAWDIFATSRRT